MENNKTPYEKLYGGNPYGQREEATTILNASQHNTSGNNTAAEYSASNMQSNIYNNDYQTEQGRDMIQEEQPMSLGNIQMYNVNASKERGNKTNRISGDSSVLTDKKKMSNKKFTIIMCSIAIIVMLVAIIVAIIVSKLSPQKVNSNSNNVDSTSAVNAEKEDVYNAALIYAALLQITQDPDMGITDGVYCVDELMAENTLAGVTFQEDIKDADTKVNFGELKGNSFFMSLSGGKIGVYAGDTIHDYYEVYPRKGGYYSSGKVIDITNTTEKNTESTEKAAGEEESETTTEATTESTEESTEASTENYGEETWTSFAFNIDGQSYSFPLNYADFEKTGYKCLDSTLEYELDPNKFTSECSAKNNDSHIIQISFKNRGEDKTTVNECQIRSISITDEKINFSLENGLKLGVSDTVAINLMGGTPDKEPGISDTEYVLVYSTTGDETGNEIKISIKDSVVVGIYIINND